MQRNKKSRDSLPQSFKTIDELISFWETHSTADYPEAFREIKGKVNLKHRRYLIALQPRLLKQVTRKAEAEGVSPETLINVWITEKLHESA